MGDRDPVLDDLLKMNAKNFDLKAQVKALTRDNQWLRAALEPFADVDILDKHPDEDPVSFITMVGDIRRAQAALKQEASDETQKAE